MLYILVDINLSKQPVSLSTATHLAFHLYVVGNAHNTFMPVQSYINIIIIIKNVFYCMVKTKIDMPIRKFFLILIGSDYLKNCSVSYVQLSEQTQMLIFFNLKLRHWGWLKLQPYLHFIWNKTVVCVILIFLQYWQAWILTRKQIILVPYYEIWMFLLQV